MRFTLTYDGPLAASGNKSRPKEKWDIRRKLSPQLKELWLVHPTLRAISVDNTTIVPADVNAYWERHHSAPFVPTDLGPASRRLCDPIKIGDHEFTPLVRDSMALVCGLDILFLRKEVAGRLVEHGGDLDNRIKTLFDALRMPSESELKFADGPIDGPFHCLLEDDRLITDTSIETGYLLTGSTVARSEVRLVINVTVRVTHIRSYNLALVGD